MVTYYLDTSALLKLYLNETGSQWLRETLASDNVSVTAQIAIIEMGSAFNRRLREGGVTDSDYATLSKLFRNDCLRSYRLIALGNSILDTAWSLLERHPLRGYDSTHLATALFVQEQLIQGGEAPLVFLSSDKRLNAAAVAEGLVVDDPNQHP